MNKNLYRMDAGSFIEYDEHNYNRTARHEHEAKRNANSTTWENSNIL